MALFKLLRVGPDNIAREILVEVPDLNILTGTINASSSSVVDTEVFATMRKIRYEITVWTGVKTSYRTMIVVSDQGGVLDQVFDKLGSVSISLNVTKVGANVEFEIVNNEVSQINYEVHKYVINS